MVKDCKGCSNLTPPSDAYQRQHFERVGFAYCKWFWQRYRQKVVVPINNVAGQVCNGVGYVEQEQTGTDEIGERPHRAGESGSLFGV